MHWASLAYTLPHHQPLPQSFTLVHSIEVDNMESQTYLAVPQQVYLAPGNTAQGNGASTASFASSITLTNASDDKHIPLPPKRQAPWIRKVRHTWLAVYQRIFAVFFLINMIALSLVLRYITDGTDLLSALATGSAFNILVTVGIRQSFVVNLIYKTCWMAPKSWPLFLRCKLAKVYELGGIHSGAAYSSTAWFIAFTGHLINDTAKEKVKALALAIIAGMLVLLLVGIIVLALPGLRSERHNTFEWTHRFGGWVSLVLFWIELDLFAQQIIASSPADAFSSVWAVLTNEPAFWFLLATTLCILWPWLLLRKLYVTPEYLSDRAIRLHFTGYKVPPFCGISISKSPLFEWHPFACMATQPSGGSLIISKAGDWTADSVCNPRPYYWVSSSLWYINKQN